MARCARSEDSARVSYDREVLQGFVDSLAGSGVSGVRREKVISCTAADAPPHNIHAFYRLFGQERRASDGLFVVTTGLGQRPLGSAVPGSLARLELFTWVDSLELAPAHAHAQDVLVALSALGRLLHDAAQPETSPWFFGHTMSFPDGEGIAGWDCFLFARHSRPVETSEGPVDLVRVVPLTTAERERCKREEDVLGGFGLVTELENRDFPGLLARWRANPESGR